MADYEVRDADIWVGGTPPTAADPDDFWFDTSKVPLFGITIVGTLPTTGPPADAGGSGEAWWDSDGHLWVWDGTVWVDQGGFRGPEGAAGPIGSTGATGPAGADGAVGATGPMGLGVSFKGALGSPAELPVDPATGDAYVITPNVFVWNGASWVTAPWVGPAGPVGPPGLTILGTLPDAGPPPGVGGAAGDTWISSDGFLWVWDGSQWSQVVIPGGGGGGDTTALEARVAALEALMSPSLAAWIATADWSPDGVPVPDPVLPAARRTGRMVL